MDRKDIITFVATVVLAMFLYYMPVVMAVLVATMAVYTLSKSRG